MDPLNIISEKILFENIFGYLSFSDLTRLSSCSKRWNHVVVKSYPPFHLMVKIRTNTLPPSDDHSYHFKWFIHRAIVTDDIHSIGWFLKSDHPTYSYVSCKNMEIRIMRMVGYYGSTLILDWLDGLIPSDKYSYIEDILYGAAMHERVDVIMRYEPHLNTEDIESNTYLFEKIITGAVVGRRIDLLEWMALAKRFENAFVPDGYISNMIEQSRDTKFTEAVVPLSVINIKYERPCVEEMDE